MRRLSTWVRAGLTAAVALCTLATVLTVSSDTAPVAPQLELAADTSQFDPGNIISDAMFFDYNALTAAQTQAFIEAKGANCRPAADGTPCLKDFRQDTFTRYGDSICPLPYYGAAGESAGMIIWRVAQVCRISPKVLLVLLQKEQALITATGSRLTPRRYEIAAGMGCPDTAACDTQYYGFYNQVYSAARQYQRYATYPTNYSYRAGANNTIYWSPTLSCGTSVVYIQNQATAGLYNYTPYRPNAAALAAGYGTGDSCSAYGNRNFWLFFTDWFGSTQSPGGDAILSAYAARGGASGPLGPAVTWVICGLANGGCGQVFQNGSLYWSAATGVHAVSEPHLSTWPGREGGPLGYPIGELVCGLTNGGCGQVFQGGRIYTTSTTGSHALSGPIEQAFIAQGAEAGALGYPITGVICGLTNGGCGQVFQGGRVYTSPAGGTHALTGPIEQAFIAQGAEAGALGYPSGAAVCGLTNGGCRQTFQNGTIYTSPASGAHALSGPIEQAFIAQGADTGALGYPITGVICGLTNGGCGQVFQNGRIYTSPAGGTHALTGPIEQAFIARGAEAGTLGYPITGLICGLKNGGCGQVFQNGRIYTSPAAGTHAISGALERGFITEGAEAGTLGYPTGDQQCGLAGGGCKQTFQGGTLVSHPTAGIRSIPTNMAASWTAAGAESGALGYPITGLICGLKNGGCGQVFQGGRIYTSPAAGTHALSGALEQGFIARGAEAGTLGYPTGDQQCGLAGGGCKQTFQGGTLVSHPTAGTHVLNGPIEQAFVAQGAEAGPLGYPITGVICGLTNGGCGQVFQNGRIFTTPATGTHILSGPIEQAFIAQRSEAGSLGYPTGDQQCGLAGGGCKQTFQGGTVVTHPTTGTFAIRTDLAAAWTAAGAEGGALGYPITGVICGLRDGGCGQVFQNGRIFTTPATGTHTLTGPIEQAFIAQRSEAGPLGYPTSQPYAVSGGTAQDFQGGRLVLDTATGTVTNG